MAYRKHSPSDNAMRRIEELLGLQLLAVPYSSTHEEETGLWTERDGLLKFIRTASRGQKFEPYYGIERTQILKAFQAYLAKAPAAYAIDEWDALPSCVHEWDDDFSVSVHRAVSAEEVQHRRRFKQRAIDELEKTLSDWKTSTNTFAQDMELELTDSARLFVENYANKAFRMATGDFSALADSPINAGIVEDMIHILRLKGSVELTTIGGFFKSTHFAKVPSQQLSARLFSAFKKRVREGMYPNPQKARDKYEGFLFDVQHASTYVPYCHAFFADRFMAGLLSDPNVAVEQTFGCKVFSVSKWQEFFLWLETIEASMTAEHADGLTWAYPKCRPKGMETDSHSSP